MSMTKDSLERMKVRELADICRAKNVPCYRGKNLLRKDELVTAILEAETAKDSHNDVSAEDTNKVGDPSAAEDGTKAKVAASGPVINMERKMPYIESAQVGALVAFRLSNGKVKSAKVVKKSTKNRRFMLETEYGAQYIVNYEDIVWVRTTKRWPLGVYRLLKGLGDDGQPANQ